MEQRDDAGREAGAPPGFPKNRTEALTDGIFAIAMTLLVLSLDVPAGVHDPSDAVIAAMLAGQLPAVYHYFLAFFILASFWVAHHAQVDRLRQIDRTFLWINIATLMFVTLVPFSVSLIGDYPGETFAAVAFEVNLLALGLLFAAQWRYATHTRRLIRPGTDIQRGNQRVMVVPAVSVVAILLALAGWTWSTAIYAIIPLVMRLLPGGR
ncbi:MULTISPECIES: TMEM175 family protein [unclassified Methanoculleus]|uniref:TMEM175 family protein n=1 Tax=unclassified Methanoculleus TaxID=2619537 RepID=UPI0025FF903F|nr:MULTISPECIES: TMEM175 family protein [unclassified Methanoculleus]